MLADAYKDWIEDLIGKVKVAALDLDGSVLAVDIIDDKGTKFLVVDNNRGEALLRHVGKAVRASGNVSYETFGRLLTIEKFCIED